MIVLDMETVLLPKFVDAGIITLVLIADLKETTR